MQKLGLIQSRGIGDICLALPIAKYYYDQDWSVHWPVCEEFWPSFRDTAPWVNWIPLPTDTAGKYFYFEPKRRLEALKCDEIIPLYQSLNVIPELSNVPWFQIQKFDEFKYTRAAVPFIKKWSLSECITRNAKREQSLYDTVVKQPLYYVTHTVGSSFKSDPDVSELPSEWQRIEITELTDCVFDWLKIIEGAQALIMLDSVYANIVDQMQIPVEKYWIPRSHIHLTPTLGMQWNILDPIAGSGAAQKIFGSS